MHSATHITLRVRARHHGVGLVATPALASPYVRSPPPNLPWRRPRASIVGEAISRLTHVVVCPLFYDLTYTFMPPVCRLKLPTDGTTAVMPSSVLGGGLPISQ